MSEPTQKYCKYCGGAMGETEIGEHYSWRVCAENLKKREKELEAVNAAFRETLRDIAHGPVGYWNEPQHREAVIRHMMQRAKEALDLDREVTR